MAKHILIIDDEEAIRSTLSDILDDEGFKPLTAASGEKGLEMLETKKVDLILLDIWLGEGIDGLEVLEKIRKNYTLPVIMISGHGTVETAVQATKKGAYDFIEKPLSYDKIILAISNGLRFAKLEQENSLLREKNSNQPIITGISPVIQSVREQISMVAPSDAWVLIRGEHGTGKELAAQSIHRESTSSAQPMVEINCAAIPDDLIESELFGHEKGSFTGAISKRRGKFDQADGGILFLDEIGDMSLSTQAKILRILQEQKFERVGGSTTISVNVRVLAATNKNLEEEIEAGHFRADLFWRLNVVPLTMPPLRSRLEDIPLLVEALMESNIAKGLQKKEFTKDAFDVMQQHDWPGNVRELRNFIERLIIMSPVTTITKKEVNTFFKQSGGIDSQTENGFSSLFTVDYKTAKKHFEREYLHHKLLEHNNNISRTAENIGLERSHLHKKLKAMEII